MGRDFLKGLPLLFAYFISTPLTLTSVKRRSSHPSRANTPSGQLAAMCPSGSLTWKSSRRSPLMFSARNHAVPRRSLRLPSPTSNALGWLAWQILCFLRMIDKDVLYAHYSTPQAFVKGRAQCISSDSRQKFYLSLNNTLE